MALTIHAASAPVFLSMLKGLSHVLARGEAYAAEHDIAPEELLNARLAQDMYPLTKQVQIASDHAKGAMARLAGRDVPRFADDEKSFADLLARVEKTRDVVKGVPEDALAGAESRQIELKLGDRTLTFDGATYLLHFAMPNFYFHVTTAYDILRARGVPLGKRDFFARR